MSYGHDFSELLVSVFIIVFVNAYIRNHYNLTEWPLLRLLLFELTWDLPLSPLAEELHAWMSLNLVSTHAPLIVVVHVEHKVLGYPLQSNRCLKLFHSYTAKITWLK